jgi:hypothetical protein
MHPKGNVKIKKRRWEVFGSALIQCAISFWTWSGGHGFGGKSMLHEHFPWKKHWTYLWGGFRAPTFLAFVFLGTVFKDLCGFFPAGERYESREKRILLKTCSLLYCWANAFLRENFQKSGLLNRSRPFGPHLKKGLLTTKGLCSSLPMIHRKKNKNKRVHKNRAF